MFCAVALILLPHACNRRVFGDVCLNCYRDMHVKRGVSDMVFGGARLCGGPKSFHSPAYRFGFLRHTDIAKTSTSCQSFVAPFCSSFCCGVPAPHKDTTTQRLCCFAS